MLKNKFVNFGGAVINTDHIVSVVFFDDGSVRIFNSLINENNPSAPSYWDYEGEQAAKIVAFFKENSQMI